MDDRRIAEIFDLIESGRYDLLSLDLFDTVIFRMVPTPRDVFFLVAGRLLADGRMFASSSPESFVRERILAEERSRRGRPAGEVTLEEIYGEFPRGFLRSGTPAEVAEIEFETELQVVRVNPDMREVIRRARERGLAVAFVSDTYFNEKRIRRLVGIDADHLLLSCREGMGKFLGLHRLLIERSGVDAARILHVGNDYRADVEGPEACGIDRYWFRVWPEAYDDLPGAELPATWSERAPVCAAGDAGVTTLRSRVMARTGEEYERWGAGVLGPVIAGFADWVVGRCRELEIDTVLCLMREGRIFRAALDLVDSGLRAREVYLSRYAARKAAVFDATEEELRDFLVRPSPQARGTLLEHLGLSRDAIRGADPGELLEGKGVLDLIRRVRADRSLRDAVVRECARARSGLLAHIRRELCGRAPRRVAVVDLGYKGTIQECLERILARERTGIRTHGLYLVTGGRVHETQATGAPVEGWLAENGQPIAMAHTFMRSPEIVEQSLMAPCGTTLGHTGTGDPVLDEFRAPAGQRAQIAAVQRGVLAYVKAWRKHRDAQGIPEPPDLKLLYRAICIRAVSRPLPVELKLFGDWVHDENFGSTSSRGLAEVAGMEPWEVEHLSAHQLASLPMSRIHWPFGFAHRMSPVMGEAVRSIFLRAVHPEAFDSAHRDQVLVAYWDTGGGFTPEQSTVRSYRLNNRGRVWQRFTLNLAGEAQRPHRMGFTIGLKDQVLQLTGVALHGSDGNGTRLERRLEHVEVPKIGYRSLGRNLYEVEEDPALLVVPFEEIPPGITHLDVDLFFGVVIGG